MLLEFWENFQHNLFKPLLLFFYLGFLIPILKVQFEFPYVIYQAVTMYLLLAIGWHGGEELATIHIANIGSIVGFIVLGFLLNFLIGFLAYFLLTRMTKMRRIDRATVAGYYGSDSAGTFATCVGVLATVGMAFNGFMSVMLAVMEMPGCLVALVLAARLRHKGMDALGNMPGEHGYKQPARVGPGAASRPARGQRLDTESELAIEQEAKIALELQEYRGNGAGEDDTKTPREHGPAAQRGLAQPGPLSPFGGIVIGLVSRLQGPKVVHDTDHVFVAAFQGVLCLFLLEMGMTASRRLKDLKKRGPRIHRLRSISAKPIRDYRDHRRSRLRSSHPRPVQAGDVYPVRHPLRRCVIHRCARGPAAGDPRGEPDAAIGRITGLDVFLQRHDRHPGLYRDLAGRHAVVHLTRESLRSRHATT